MVCIFLTVCQVSCLQCKSNSSHFILVGGVSRCPPCPAVECVVDSDCPDNKTCDYTERTAGIRRVDCAASDPKCKGSFTLCPVCSTGQCV